MAFVSLFTSLAFKGSRELRLHFTLGFRFTLQQSSKLIAEMIILPFFPSRQGVAQVFRVEPDEVTQ